MIVPKLLADRTFDIEFQSYLSNHAKHAIVALQNIHATDDRIQEWWDAYTQETPYGYQLHKVDQDWDSVQPCSQEQWKKWNGKKVHWQEMSVFMQRELNDRFNGDISQLIREYAPPLIPGMAGALTHGIIHLGWAIDAKSDWMIVEGLAYLNFCNVGVEPSKISVDQENAETNPLDSFTRIAKTWDTENLADTWIASVMSKYGEDFHSELVPAGFQWQLAKVMHEPHEVATKVPKWLLDTPLTTLWENIYRTVVLVYLASRDAEGNGNFLILHAMTSLWGLEHVLQVIDDEEVTRKSLQQYYTMLVCLLAGSASGFPTSSILSKPSILSKAANEYPVTSTEIPDWKPIEARGMAEEEEHNIKLVYVCRELWKRYNNWSGFCDASRAFILTPNIGPGRAATSAVKPYLSA